MLHLAAVSLIWAFSFGLTQGRLSGVDSAWVAALRLGLAALVFAPWLRRRAETPGVPWRWAAVGAIQFGAMYLALMESYRYLPSHQVALLTITTPLWVLLLSGGVEAGRGLRVWSAAGLAVIAGGILSAKANPGLPAWPGVLLVQGANLCFASGQVAFRRWKHADRLTEAQRCAWGYLGAAAITLPVAWLRHPPHALVLSGAQMATLAYLGILASGLCFFWWNVGASRVTAGLLAVMNNAKVPLAVLCSLLVFGEAADLPRLVGSGAALLLALWLVRR